MKAGIIQSCYVPWRGYFDFIASVDVFVYFDDVAFGAKGNWRHRNQLKRGDALVWLTIPVKSSRSQPIDEVAIDGTEWKKSHEGLIRDCLRRAPYFEDALALWKTEVDKPETRLSPLNRRLTEAVCRYLGITTPLRDAREFGAAGAKTERLLDLLGKLGADAYLSGPAARGYLDEAAFKRCGIRLEYKSYDYDPYPQQGGAFQGAVSVLDLIANTGPKARRHIRSRTPDEVAVP